MLANTFSTWLPKRLGCDGWSYDGWSCDSWKQPASGDISGDAGLPSVMSIDPEQALPASCLSTGVALISRNVQVHQESSLAGSATEKTAPLLEKPRLAAPSDDHSVPARLNTSVAAPDELVSRSLPADAHNTFPGLSSLSGGEPRSAFSD